MNVDERARQAARRLHEEAADLDTDSLLARVEARSNRTRWLAPALVTAVVVAIVSISAVAVARLLDPGPSIPAIDEVPDTQPDDEPGDEAPNDAEPTPGKDPGGGAPPETCSATELEQPGSQSGPPEAVAATRDEIARAALACDLDALGAIAARGERPFTYSFGGEDDPVGYWRRLEEEGHQPPGPTWWMVRVLDLPYATVETQFRADEYENVYVWPSAFAVEDPDSEDWRLLVEEGLYTEEELEQFREFGGYIGYRVGITEDGEWVFFVAGD